MLNTFSYSSTLDADRFSAGRLTIWLNTFNLVKSQGWVAILTGLGPDGFARHGIYPNIVHPHNAFIQIFAEAGILGVLLFVLFLIGVVRNVVRHLSGPIGFPVKIACFLFIGGLAYSMVDGIFYHVYPVTMMIFLMAVIDGTQERVTTNLVHAKEGPAQDDLLLRNG